MRCPKCGGPDFQVYVDRRCAASSDPDFALVFSCRCGKQMFGPAVREEHDRQQRLYEASVGARREEQRARETARREAERRDTAARLSAVTQSETAARHRTDAAVAERARADAPPPDATLRLENTPGRERVPASHDDEHDHHDDDSGTCAWPGCEKQARNNSKYCSRACSNKNARSRHKKRKRDDGSTEAA